MGVAVVPKLTLDRLAPVTHGDVSCHATQCDKCLLVPRQAEPANRPHFSLRNLASSDSLSLSMLTRMNTWRSPPNSSSTCFLVKPAPPPLATGSQPIDRLPCALVSRQIAHRRERCSPAKTQRIPL